MNKFLKFEVDFDHFIEKLQEKINQNNQIIEGLLKIENKTYNNFVRVLEILEEKMDEFFTPMAHLNSVKNSETTQKVYSQSLPIITEYTTKLSQNLDIYKAFKSIEALEKAQLNQEQLRVLELNIQSFELSGANLEEEKKKRLEAINLRMSELGNDFSQNLINAVNDYELILEEPDVDGLSEDDKKSYEIEVDGVKKYRFTLQMPPYITYMTYGKNHEIREKLYKAYITKAPQNAVIIDELMQLRQEMSKILGYKNYAAYSLAPKMAEKEEEVISFLEKLAHAAKPIAKQELATLQAFAKQKDLQSYDLSFYSEKLKKATYDFDQDLYRPYFEQHTVVAGLFKFLNLLFGIRFEKVEVPLWDASASAYNVMVGDKLTARLYLDLESRQGKSGGAWMHNWQSHYDDGVEHLASAFVVCNFPSSEKSPSLLRHDDVVTLFHEMGHALHHMLSKVSEVGVSGISGVAWDVVEFPSQFLENFAYEPKVLKIFASHYKSGEILSDAMINKIVAVKNFQSALGILRQVEFSLFDFKLHQKLYLGQEVQDLLDQVRAETSLMKPPTYNKFQNGFAHIFAGGYAAGYYSYKWAEVLSADAFFAIVDQGIFNTKFGQDYLNIVLRQGGSQSMKALYHELKGADAKVESLLRLNGIKTESEAS